MKNIILITMVVSLCLPSMAYPDDTRQVVFSFPDQSINDFFDNPSTTFKQQSISTTFGIILLSHLSEYITNLRITKQIDLLSAESYFKVLIKTATSPVVSPFQGEPIKKSALQQHGLYLSHLNIIYGSYKRATGNDNYLLENKMISEHLAKNTTDHPTKHIRSYDHIALRWPADQAATLYSLHLYDNNYNDNVSKVPIEQWLAYMAENATNSKWGLPYSEVTGGVGYAKLPRGCALSYIVRYMGVFSPDNAIPLWKQYKKHYKVDVIFAGGFREWPPGVKGKADVDSGPIVMGIGAGATGIALGASKVVNDMATYYQLQSACAFATTFGGEPMKGAGKSLLARSIELFAETYTPWFR